MPIRRIYVGVSTRTGQKYYRVLLPKDLVESLGMCSEPYLDEKGRPVVEISVQAATPPTLVLRSVRKEGK